MAFPLLSPAFILAFQFSAWYPLFAPHSIKSTIIPLDPAFVAYLDADGVFVPAGAEDTPAESTLSDDEHVDDDDDEREEGEDSGATRPQYAFPALDAQIRACVREYGGVFPKLNFSAPKDAAWLLPAASPLKCTSPADVYLLLKSSDFVTHDLSRAAVFAGCEPEGGSSSSSTGGERKSEDENGGENEHNDGEPLYALELVLRKWYPVDRARELRCFVRDDMLLAISQRDTNFYPFWADPHTRGAVARAVRRFWRAEIRPRWPAQKDYIVDLLLTRDLARAHIVDFNPYHPKTDPLLFTYDELYALYQQRPREGGDAQKRAKEEGGGGDDDDDSALPVFRVIDSAAHPAASRNAPTHQHNMIPFEAASMSSGRDIEEFAEMWKDSVQESMEDDE